MLERFAYSASQIFFGGFSADERSAANTAKGAGLGSNDTITEVMPSLHSSSEKLKLPNIVCSVYVAYRPWTGCTVVPSSFLAGAVSTDNIVEVK